MSETTDAPKPAETARSKTMLESRGMAVKFVLIAILFGLLQIPLMMIGGTIEERKSYNVDYPLQYKGPGAGQQTIIGPILTIPYHYQVTEKKHPPTDQKTQDAQSDTTETVTKTGYLHLFPDKLTVNGKLDPQIRDEGKFKSILYSSSLDVRGVFNTKLIKLKKTADRDLLWQDAFVSLGISDLRGIRRETSLDIGGEKVVFAPGLNGIKVFDSGQYAPVSNIHADATFPFSCTIALNGSRAVNIFPAGKENDITVSSSWKEPTFTGGFLPTHKKVDKDGFYSLWEVSYLTRNLSQVWTDADPDIKSSLAQYMVGVELATPVDFYRTATRAVKYGSLFIVMTFATFFIFEMLTKIRIHEIQYLLVGLALSLFFLMLVAISEWIPFVWAYVLASFATISQITFYTRAFSKSVSPRMWQAMAAMLTSVYVYLYILLELEDLSLLIGAIGLFIAMTIVFYTTRNVDWYGKETHFRALAEKSE